MDMCLFSKRSRRTDVNIVTPQLERHFLDEATVREPRGSVEILQRRWLQSIKGERSRSTSVSHGLRDEINSFQTKALEKPFSRIQKESWGRVGSQRGRNHNREQGAARREAKEEDSTSYDHLFLPLRALASCAP